jgi:hypothetical protein
MQDFRYILPILAVFAITACQSNQQIEDRLVSAFEETMFDGGSGHHGQGRLFSESGNLARWETPVSVAVVEGANSANERVARERILELSALSGLEFVWAIAGDPEVELEIRFSNESDFIINGNQRAACYARVGNVRDGIIGSAGVYIGKIGDDRWRTDCLAHELLHALGWRGHTHRVRSAISYAHGETELTRWDRMMMRTLYDPRLPPGISKEDAIPIARVILREMIEE